MVLTPIDDIMSEDNRFLNADGDIQMKEQPSMIQLVLELVLNTQGRACVCVRDSMQLTTATVSGEGRVQMHCSPEVMAHSS